ncbi:hypothetical protein [Flagellimonas sp.]|uniref:hypothetical protein n=1 Tax=Flagellimonas sp. TaxID=2058762 RepID=UPI003B58E2D4
MAIQKIKPHRVFWILGLVLIALQLFFIVSDENSSALYLNIHDIYYAVAYAHICNALGGWFILCGYGYWMFNLFKIKIVEWMFWAHLVLSLLFCFAVGLSFSSDKSDTGNLVHETVDQLTIFITVTGFLIGQILFVSNALISMIRIKRR